LKDWDQTISTAQQLDQDDSLKRYRDQFHIPIHNGKPWIYMCGNSLGLQLKSVKSAIESELNNWQNLGVEGWFEGDNPWMDFADRLSAPMANIVGAKTSEVTIMNTLTVNLHLLLASFYKPSGTKTKILMEKGAFPSDHHMVDSQIKWHALVFLGGVNYATGQVLDMAKIAQCCHHNDILLGLDLAHAVGNVPLLLHDWKVDFAAWCTYKYLNSGPGGPGGIFIHKKHADRPRLAGWWGHESSTRFLMEDGHIPEQGAAGWQEKSTWSKSTRNVD